MKLTALLGALLLTASPTSAEDLVYLKCDATIQYKQIDLIEKVVVDEQIENTIIHYEIDLLKKLLTDSDDPEGSSVVKIFNGMIFSQIEGYKQGTMNVNFVDTQIAFDPPGKISGRSTIRANDNSFEVTADLAGRCEASDASAYESSK
ncbi:putative conserved secreted protein [Synechococcus sp. A18-25c]|uniref:hypothetical protein n=1 Tax=unclassified Synechococcus TaxID=2626047 RepID=UPI00164809B0|nr:MULTISPECIES: hypothetical protein [unclassified Synechococcus]QNI48555.1 putative conserved secreted protein [Synechococcus sp. A15-60]QNJ20184.1 putative conserved secreted protein [Synechococcus sp. A18-25c]